MKVVSPEELDRMINEETDLQIIDVRERYEYEDQNIGGINIPLAEVLENTDVIDRNKQVVFCCKSGKRAAAMTHTLERKFGMTNLFSLEGGMEAYFEFKQ